MSKAYSELSQTLLEDQNWSCPFVFYNADNQSQKYDISNYLVTTNRPYQDGGISSYCNLTKLFGFQSGDKDTIVKSMHLSAKALGFNFTFKSRPDLSNLYWDHVLHFKCSKSILCWTNKTAKSTRSSQHALTNETRCCCIPILIKLHKATSEWYIIPHHYTDSQHPSISI